MQLGSNGFLTVRQPDGEMQTRFYYGAFAGEHVCAAADTEAGDCDVPTGASNTGLITADAKAPGVQVKWAGHDGLPRGPIRLRFTQTGGDLYAYTVN